MKTLEKWKLVAVTSILWTLTLSSCAGLRIKWWFFDKSEAPNLIRRHADKPNEYLSPVEADGYICSSPMDWEVIDQCLKTCDSKSLKLVGAR